MLFNSFEFLGLFLPLTLALWGLARWLGARLGGLGLGLRLGLGVLTLASLLFYGDWNAAYLPLLVASVAVDFVIGQRILRARRMGAGQRAGRWMWLGVGLNLGVLGVFKYAWFVADNLAALAGTAVPFGPLVLPLGISFITFQKIAYLVDCRRGLVRQSRFLEYVFFVTFFPQLIAGPIVHHRGLIAQLDARGNPLLANGPPWSLALMLFAIGLFKKTVLADQFALFADPVFAAASSGAVAGAQAWQGMLAYTLQLYFDFSGYADMALGLGLLFGLKLPVNFDSPYRARSIIEFWRRWNITLSQFLRDYLYIPLGGGRRGEGRRALNLLLTMLLGGLWHGAGWTFIAWGGLHGLFLLINHRWRGLLERHAGLRARAARVPDWCWVGLTFSVVALAWVPFRAEHFAAAARLYAGLLRLDELGAALGDAAWPPTLGFWQAFLAAEPAAVWSWLALGLAIVWLLPTGWRWAGYDAEPNQRPRARGGLAAGLLTGTLLWMGLKALATSPASPFLYFNF